MKPGDRVQLTEDGAEVAFRCDSPGSMAANVGTVREGPFTGLVKVKRDGAHRLEVWAVNFWEPLSRAAINAEAPHE